MFLKAERVRVEDAGWKVAGDARMRGEEMIRYQAIRSVLLEIDQVLALVVDKAIGRPLPESRVPEVAPGDGYDGGL